VSLPGTTKVFPAAFSNIDMITAPTHNPSGVSCTWAASPSPTTMKR